MTKEWRYRMTGKKYITMLSAKNWKKFDEKCREDGLLKTATLNRLLNEAVELFCKGGE